MCTLFNNSAIVEHKDMVGMSENVFINVKNRSHTITAELEIPKKGASGVILAQAGRFGGWSLYVKDGKPSYTYNWLGLYRYTVAAQQALPAGKVNLRFEFAYDGGGVGNPCRDEQRRGRLSLRNLGHGGDPCAGCRGRRR